MNKLLVAGLGWAGIAVVGAAVYAPHYLGSKIESVTRETWKSDAFQPFVADVVKYDRSLASSNVEIKLSLDPNCVGKETEMTKDVYLVYRSQLTHGPYIDGFKAAFFTGDITLSPAYQQKLTTITGQKALLTINGTYNIDGSSNQVINLPQFEYKGEHPAGILKFSGLTINSQVSADGKRIVVDGKSEGLTYKELEKQNEIMIGAIALNGQMQQEIGVWIGDSAITVKEANGQTDGKPFFHLEGLSGFSKTSLNDAKLLKSGAQLSVTKLTSAQASPALTNLGYDIAIKNLPLEPVSRIESKMRCVQAQKLLAMITRMQKQATDKDDAATTAPSIGAIDEAADKDNHPDTSDVASDKFFSDILPDLKLVVAAGPSVEINRIGADTLEGPVNFSGNIKLAGVTDADWAQPFMLLLQRLAMDGKLSVPLPLLPSSLSAVIQALVKEGYVTQQDKQLSTNFKYANAQWLVNDKSIERLAQLVFSDDKIRR